MSQNTWIVGQGVGRRRDKMEQGRLSVSFFFFRAFIMGLMLRFLQQG
jgi:hypothetical protein